MTKKELATARVRHAAGLPWYDGPELLNAYLGDDWFGIGTREELDALKANETMPTEATYRPLTPDDLV